MEPIVCPECGAKIEVPNDVLKGEIITCPDCGLELEVKEINSSSVIVEELWIEGEDWGE
ncbi:MAG: lysine biosynthesis protein LysW [Candidatus Bathyarchaeia archaeon]